MWAARLSLLLCVSLAAPAAAEEAFITQLRLPARETSVDAFAWRGDDGVAVERSALERLGVAVPAAQTGERVALAAIPGLTYAEDEGAAAIILNCVGPCLPTQRLGGLAEEAIAPARSPWGVFLNYDTAAELQSSVPTFGGVGQANLFGPLGRGVMTWLGTSEGGVARLDTSWVMDLPRRQLRLRFGDSAAPGVDGGVARFAGIQIGRNFNLTPSLITHPTPLLTGEAESASTVELYIDGELRTREQVQSGPFEIDSTPFVSGAGQADVVVTDLLGRQQVLSRSFFVSTELLRQGLSDWSVALGAEREGYGESRSSYGAVLGVARYRRGITNALTAEAGFDATQAGGAGQLAATFAHPWLGQVRVSRAQGALGGANAIAYFRDGGVWSWGVQVEDRDPAFASIGRAGGARRTAAASFNVRLGDMGAVGFTAASADFIGEANARTFAFAYSPHLLGASSMSFRIGHAERERSEFTFGFNFSRPLNGVLSTSYAVDYDRRGPSFRASAQQPMPIDGGFGWQARSVNGVGSRFDFAANYRGALGDGAVRVARAGSEAGVRVEQSGAVGWVQGRTFAGQQINGAFALVDAGAPGVSIMRDRLRSARTGRNGLALITNLRPYNSNVIAIAPSELPLDEVAVTPEVRVAPQEGTGMVIRFDRALQRLQEARVRFADGETPLRGAVLVRERDGARFPIGSEGRVVLLGAEAGDRLQLEGRAQCQADVGESDLTLRCAA